MNNEPSAVNVEESRRTIANRENAKKSTGPRTPEGKAISSKNALKHGMTSREVLLPGEDGEELASKLEAWQGAMRSKDVIETDLVDVAVSSLWRIKRCVRSETSKIAERMRHAVEEFDVEQFKRAEILGDRLTRDVINRCMIPGKDPLTQKSLQELRANDPVLIAREMMSFAAGVDWLLGRWQKLRDNLEDDKFLHYPDKYEMCRMLGLRNEDSMIDPIVREIMTCCNLAHPEAWNYNDEVIQASLAVEGKPSYAFLTERHVEKGPQTEEEAFTRLLTIMAKEMVRLRELRETKLAPMEALDRDQAVDRVLFDDSKEAALALRYEATHKRELHRALEAIAKKRKGEIQAAKREESDEWEPLDPENSHPTDRAAERTQAGIGR